MSLFHVYALHETASTTLSVQTSILNAQWHTCMFTYIGPLTTIISDPDHLLGNLLESRICANIVPYEVAWSHVYKA